MPGSHVPAPLWVVDVQLRVRGLGLGPALNFLGNAGRGSPQVEEGPGSPDYAGAASLSEKAMAAHSSTLAWKIPWMEEPGGLQSMGLLGVGHN